MNNLNDYLQNRAYCSIKDVEFLSGESRSTIIRRIGIGTLKAFKRTGSNNWIIKTEDAVNYLENRGY